MFLAPIGTHNERSIIIWFFNFGMELFLVQFFVRFNCFNLSVCVDCHTKTSLFIVTHFLCITLWLISSESRFSIEFWWMDRISCFGWWYRSISYFWSMFFVWIKDEVVFARMILWFESVLWIMKILYSIFSGATGILFFIEFWNEIKVMNTFHCRSLILFNSLFLLGRFGRFHAINIYHCMCM